MNNSEEYKKYIEYMKQLYLESHKDLSGFDEWFKTAQDLCDLMCQ
jgi:hypothetical protein